MDRFHCGFQLLRHGRQMVSCRHTVFVQLLLLSAFPFTPAHSMRGHDTLTTDSLLTTQNLTSHEDGLSGVALASSTLLADTGRVMTFNEFCTSTQLKFNGDARKFQRSLFLTSGGSNERGSVWLTEPVDVAGGFRTAFRFVVTRTHTLRGAADPDSSSGEGHGFAFVIQSESPSALGAVGAGLAYHGISDAVVVEFDTFRDPGLHDPDSHHVSLHVSPKPGAPVSAHDDYSRFEHRKCPSFNDGEPHTAVISYEIGQLSISVDGVNILKDAKFDLSEHIHLRGNAAFVGFTAATGAAYQNYVLKDWALNLNSHSKSGQCVEGFTGTSCSALLSEHELTEQCASYTSCMSCNEALECCGWCGGVDKCVSGYTAHKTCPESIESFGEGVCNEEVLLRPGTTIPVFFAMLLLITLSIYLSDYCVKVCLPAFDSVVDTSALRNAGQQGQTYIVTLDATEDAYGQSLLQPLTSDAEDGK